jgi:site-specific DNA-methyltransferase (adenine-specific)
MLETNKIHKGDALELLKLIPDNSVDLILTDPPYNTGMISTSNNGRLCNFFNDKYSLEEYENLVKKSCSEFYRVLKENKAIYIYINWKSLGIWVDNMKLNNFNIKNVIIWNKIVHGLNYQNYAHTYEMIIFATKGIFFPQNKSVKDKNNGFYKDVWNIQRKIDNSNDKNHHETVKITKVVEIPILHSTNPQDLVLDPFIGSGTTAVACLKLNRNFIGFELNQEYVDMANKRIEVWKGQQRLFE